VHNYTTPDWYKASTFDVVHDAGYSTAMYASKFKFIIFEQSYNATPGPTHPDVEDEISTYYGPESTASMQSALLSGLAANNFKYTFVHYADLDDAGHSSLASGGGWGNSSYMTAIGTVDNYLGQLFNLVTNDPELKGKTAIVLSADHGGTTGTTGHSLATNAANYTIPFYVWGAGVAHGDLYAFNAAAGTSPATRTSPSSGTNPAYTAGGQPIRNGDGGNLALNLLGLGAIPGSFINSSQNLQVALPGDFNLDNAVDTADYIAWRKGIGTPSTQGRSDLWRANFGRSLAGGSGGSQASIPEPSMGMLIVAGAFLASNRRRRREFLNLPLH
jgi:hypothetical protein